MRERYLSPTLFLSLVARPELQALANLVPWADQRRPQQGKTTAYVCERQTCLAPITELEDFLKALEPK